MKFFCYVIFLGLFASASARTEPIKKGSGIQKAETELSTFGFRRGAINKVHIDQIREFIGFPEKDADKLDELRIWRVDEGYLLISYTASSGIIHNLKFYWREPRYSADAADFELRVSSFDPATGQMVVETAQPKRENKAE